jgi:F-type H+-transporting ATPase subunit delta
VSGGFAVVQPDSRLSVNAVEAYPLEDFSAEVSLFIAVYILIF